MIAGVVIDDWKLDTFTKHLDRDGFTYERTDGPFTGMITLRVTCESAEKLAPTIRKAQNECRWGKPN